MSGHDLLGMLKLVPRLAHAQGLYILLVLDVKSLSISLSLALSLSLSLSLHVSLLTQSFPGCREIADHVITGVERS